MLSHLSEEVKGLYTAQIFKKYSHVFIFDKKFFKFGISKPDSSTFFSKSNSFVEKIIAGKVEILFFCKYSFTESSEKSSF